jgi:hypothetical protein
MESNMVDVATDNFKIITKNSGLKKANCAIGVTVVKKIQQELEQTVLEFKSAKKIM